VIVDVDGVAAHASTGGVELTGDDPVVLFLHGAGMDCTVWQLQTRWFAYHGYRSVAVDLPGHGRSAGAPLATIEEIADWVARFVAAAGFESSHVVAHSMGTFVALELASHHPSIVASLTLCGTATTMPVHPDLLEAAQHDLPAAAALMASWGHAQPAHVGGNPTPGLWMLGGARALVERSAPGVLATDFRACMDYENASAAAAAVTCRCTVVIGLGDKMTPPKAGRALAAALAPHANSSSRGVVELSGTGHSMMTENPRAVRRAIAATIAG
jgi:pimeloyl-ACP methyl ester carboxylesterase